MGDEPAVALRTARSPDADTKWKRCRVGLDDHVAIAKPYSSVPHQLIRQEGAVRITLVTVEIVQRGKRVASHRGPSAHGLVPWGSARSYRLTTVAEHMPSSHRRYRDWTHDRMRREAAMIGPNTAALADVIRRSRPHPEQGFRSCIGLLGLVRCCGAARVDAACARALVLGTRSSNSVAVILKNHRENAALPAEAPILIHDNIRGPGYDH